MVKYNSSKLNRALERMSSVGMLFSRDILAHSPSRRALRSATPISALLTLWNRHTFVGNKPKEPHAPSTPFSISYCCRNQYCEAPASLVLRRTLPRLVKIGLSSSANEAIYVHVDS